MSKKINDINDDEIRIITGTETKTSASRNCLKRVVCLIIGVVILGVVTVLIFSAKRDGTTEVNPSTSVDQIHEAESIPQMKDEKTPGFTIPTDIDVEKVGLLILTPENALPSLVIGNEILSDSSIILATQAADIRSDNAQIAGTFVIDGELISKGEAKAGFCSIVNGEITIGVADATPMLEQAITGGGYFFRQYPLVVSGQIVENKPKGKAIRKALAEIEGKIKVVMSKERLTFHEFSQVLVDAGVRNAIYLVGASSYGFYVNKEGERVLTGLMPTDPAENTNYIIWK